MEQLNTWKISGNHHDTCRFPKINGKTTGLEHPYFRKRRQLYLRTHALSSLGTCRTDCLKSRVWPVLRSGDVALPEACPWISPEKGLPVSKKKTSTVEDEDSLGVWEWTMYQRPIFWTHSYFWCMTLMMIVSRRQTIQKRNQFYKLGMEHPQAQWRFLEIRLPQTCFTWLGERSGCTLCEFGGISVYGPCTSDRQPSDKYGYVSKPNI